MVCKKNLCEQFHYQELEPVIKDSGSALKNSALVTSADGCDPDLIPQLMHLAESYCTKLNDSL